MNERIKELIPRPWTFPYPDREMYSREQMEQFAELIVRECMGVAKGMRNPSNLNYKPSDHFVNELRLHFGVEK
jgi:hypothetical protein